MRTVSRRAPYDDTNLCLLMIRQLHSHIMIEFFIPNTIYCVCAGQHVCVSPSGTLQSAGMESDFKKPYSPRPASPFKGVLFADEESSTSRPFAAGRTAAVSPKPRCSVHQRGEAAPRPPSVERRDRKRSRDPQRPSEARPTHPTRWCRDDPSDHDRKEI